MFERIELVEITILDPELKLLLHELHPAKETTLMSQEIDIRHKTQFSAERNSFQLRKIISSKKKILLQEIISCQVE